MDFENMMVTPAIYQDIPTSFMMNPMPMMPMYGMYPGMYPTYGVGPMRPALSNDKFQKLEDKEKETKHTLRNTGIIAAALITAAVLFSKKFKAPSIQFFKNLGTKIKSGYAAAKAGAAGGLSKVKNGAVNLWNKFTSLFKKKP